MTTKSLTAIEDVLTRDRQPIDPVTVIAALAYDRVRWPKWSDSHRSTARWDIEVALDAELKHAEHDWNRIVSQHNARLMFETDSKHQQPPWTYWYLPRERAAMHALNALRHAAIARKSVSDHIKIVRSQKRGANDMALSASARLDWQARLVTSRESLGALRRRRQRDWRRFLDLMAQYKKARDLT